MCGEWKEACASPQLHMVVETMNWPLSSGKMLTLLSRSHKHQEGHVLVF